MKKVLCVVLCVAMIMMLAACGSKLSSEKAIDIALDDLGINRIAAARTDAVLDEAKGVYNVTIDRNAFKNLYVIDAKTGAIISSETVDSNR